MVVGRVGGGAGRGSVGGAGAVTVGSVVVGDASVSDVVVSSSGVCSSSSPPPKQLEEISIKPVTASADRRTRLFTQSAYITPGSLPV